MNWDSVGAYGCPVPGTTPHIDALASVSTRFTNAYVTVGVCAPSRGVMMTGRYPHSTGATGFGLMPASVRTVPELLKAAGYVCGIIDKIGHLRPVEKYGWAKTYADTSNGRSPKSYGRITGEFIKFARESGRPFFLMANARDPHRPFAGSRQERQYIDNPRNADERNWAQPRAVAGMGRPSRIFRTDEVVVPAFLPDIPDIREEVANYYSSVRRCDDTVGAILEALEDSGQSADTIVLFLSDNGMAFPFAKFSCYPNGTRTPLIVRWPGRTRENEVMNEVVGGVDLAPTLLEAAGVHPPSEMDGRSFLPLLLGADQEDRVRAFAAFYETQLREQVPTRAVYERQYCYIYNRWSDGATECQDEFHKGLALQAIIEAARTDGVIAKRLVHFLFRTPEELYDMTSDPHALRNLADNTAYRETLERLRGEMETWMIKTGDPLLPVFRACRAGVIIPMSGPPEPGGAKAPSKK
ncbi:MAG: sulfatase [Opitutaceae bacterium]|nr:sulfatase [Opitutaceae bacterium]